MENTIYVGLSRQTALRREMSLVANNIANANTTAFKRELGVYVTYPEQNRVNGQIDFVIDHGTAVSFEPGALQPTENAFDFAINGPGFFAVDDGTGPKYTRNGSFSLNADNQLVTRDGFAVLDEDDNPILIPRDGRRVEFASDGTINAGNEVIGRLQVVEFDALHLMQKTGNSMFETTEEPKPATRSALLQGQLEGSNINAVKELTRMIEVQRSYEAVKGMLDREAERQRTTTQRLGRPNAAA